MATTLYLRPEIYQMPVSPELRVRGEIRRHEQFGATMREIAWHLGMEQLEVAKIITLMHFEGEIKPRLTNIGIIWLLEEFA